MVSQERVGFYPAGHPRPETRPKAASVRRAVCFQPCTRLISSPLTRTFSGELLCSAAPAFQ